jgi:hypothetical protein
MPVLARWRDEIRESVQKLKRQHFDDALGHWPSGLSQAARADPVDVNHHGSPFSRLAIGGGIAVNGRAGLHEVTLPGSPSRWGATDAACGPTDPPDWLPAQLTLERDRCFLATGIPRLFPAALLEWRNPPLIRPRPIPFRHISRLSGPQGHCRSDQRALWSRLKVSGRRRAHVDHVRQPSAAAP